MIITHASYEKIKKVSPELDGPLRGCLFFGYEGNTYNLTQCNFQYNLEVDEDNTIEAIKRKVIKGEVKNLANDKFSLNGEYDEIIDEVADKAIDKIGVDNIVKAKKIFDSFK